MDPERFAGLLALWTALKRTNLGSFGYLAPKNTKDRGFGFRSVNLGLKTDAHIHRKMSVVCSGHQCLLDCPNRVEYDITMR